ncbi:hypothetical protein CXF74_15720 [Psychromonas sp. Urea-02u-13]|nr:hypothetical protein CXF74_15720 [Psychromonas sp. Urea-02u-13]
MLSFSLIYDGKTYLDDDDDASSITSIAYNIGVQSIVVFHFYFPIRGVLLDQYKGEFNGLS